MSNISKDKTRTMLTIEKSLKAELEEMAKNEERSLNGMIIYIIKEYMKEKQKKDSE